MSFIDKIKKFKVAKSIASLALCSTMLFGIGSLSACKNNNPTVAPGNQTEQSGTDSTESNNELPKYSQILQTVLTDSYYKGLANEMRNNLTINKYRAIPFSFLQEHGHDVNNVKNDNLSCTCRFYFKQNDKNNLYCFLNVENSANENYYTNYNLKYNISNTEYNEITMLVKGEYLQSTLFMQELDNQKIPVIINKMNVNKTTFDNLTSNIAIEADVISMFGNSDYTNISIVDVYPSDNNYIVDLNVYHSQYSVGIQTGETAHLSLKFVFTAGVTTDNNILKIVNTSRYLIQNSEDLQASNETVSILNCATAYGKEFAPTT